MENTTARKPQLYALFLKVEDKWVRQPGAAYRKKDAIRVYQNRLLNHSFLGDHPELRPVKE